MLVFLFILSNLTAAIYTCTLTNICCLKAEEADDDDIYNVLSTLKRLTAFHK